MNVIKDVVFEGTILQQVGKDCWISKEYRALNTLILEQSGKFITRRDYPKFVIQEMVVNACCHRAYNIKGTEIQIKMFDDRICIFKHRECPATRKPSNISDTHFSENRHLAQFRKTYHYVKEYGEGVDRMYRELEVNGAAPLSLHKTMISFWKFLPQRSQKSLEENRDGEVEKLVENVDKLIEKLVEKATGNGDKFTKTQLPITG